MDREYSIDELRAVAEMQSVSPVWGWLSSLGGLLVIAFTIWMIVDCWREGRGFLWIWIMIIFNGFGALVYFFLFKFQETWIARQVIRQGQINRRRRELEAKVHHIDNAYHYTELGDFHLKHGNSEEAEKAYRAAIERDPRAEDASIHLGYALLGLGRPEEAWPHLEPALTTQPDYEYGELMWQAARCQSALGNPEAARELYERLLARYDYAQARLEYCDVLEKIGEHERRTEVLKKMIADAPHAPKFQQRKERKFVRMARKALAEQGVKV